MNILRSFFAITAIDGLLHNIGPLIAQKIAQFKEKIKKIKKSACFCDV
jgi:hypothetical protein